MESKVKLNRAIISPQKARLVADQIRGKRIMQAQDILNFSGKKAAVMFKKLIDSAVSNIENQYGEDDLESLKVTEVFVNEGMTLKRIKPRAKGRADRILKRTSHITLKVEKV